MSNITNQGIMKDNIDCITKAASFSFSVWRPYAYLHMRSIAISLKVNEKQVSY